MKLFGLSKENAFPAIWETKIPSEFGSSKIRSLVFKPLNHPLCRLNDILKRSMSCLLKSNISSSCPFLLRPDISNICITYQACRTSMEFLVCFFVVFVFLPPREVCSRVTGCKCRFMASDAAGLPARSRGDSNHLLSPNL